MKTKPVDVHQPYVRSWNERVRTTYESDLASATDPSFAVDQSVEDIVHRFTRLGESALNALKARSGGAFVDVTAYQDKSPAELYINSRDKIGAAALKKAQRQAELQLEGAKAMAAAAEAAKAAAAAPAAVTPPSPTGGTPAAS